MIKKQKKNGITLITLVVTIVILLILAATSIAMLTGEKGIITQAKRAKEENEKAQENEKSKLDELYSSIKVALGDDAEVTINMKDLKTIIDERIEEKLSSRTENINSNSVLMNSSNASLEVGNINLKSFTNTFGEKFSEYFEYDSSTGQMTCLQDGEYMIKMQLDMCSNSSSAWSRTKMNCNINNINVITVDGVTSTGTTEACDNNSTTIHLKKGNIISFSKETMNNKLASRNNANITIIKM